MIKLLKENSKGMTLIGVLVTVALIGTIGSTLVTSIFSILSHTANSNAHVTAAFNAEEAAFRISKDGQMAQSTNLTSSTVPVNSMKLTWNDPETGDDYEIDYFLSGENLQRRETINSVDQGVATVARYITGIEFSQPAGDDRLFTANVTASGGDYQALYETREYHVTLRAETQ